MFSVAQLWLILWDTMDFSLPGYSVHGIFQARILSALPFPYLSQCNGLSTITGLRDHNISADDVKEGCRHRASWE